MKQNVSPHNVLVLVTAALLLVAIAAVQLATSSPWFGLKLSAAEQGARVIGIVEHGPAANSGLQHGDLIIAIKIVGDSAALSIEAGDLMIEPDDHASYKNYFLFFQKQTQLHQIVTAKTVLLKTADGKNIAVSPEAQKPLSELSFYFWFQLACGFAVVLMAAMVWVYASDQMGPRLYMLAAVGLLVAIFPSAIYTTRELSIDGELFEALSRMNQLGVLFFCGFGTAILWYYPNRISHFSFIKAMLLAVGVLFSINYFALYESLHLGVRLPIVLWLLLDVTLAVVQWRRTATDPVARAQVKWFILAWFVGPVFYTALNVFPLLVGYEPVLTQETGWLLFVFVYLAIALGLIKYRLFNLDKWILTAWFWFLCGLAFILVDAIVIALTGMSQNISLMLLLAITGWLYIPLRQLTLDRVLARRSGRDQDNTVSALLNEILRRAPNEKPDELWPDILQQLFQPLQINQLDDRADKVTVQNHGQSILIPALPGSLAVCLYNAQKGARLFSPDDAALIESVWMIYKHVLAFQQAQHNGARIERRRIARDLHDDVSAKVLSLVYRADNDENADLARETLSDLRSVIHDLESKSISLKDAVREWRLEAKRRCEEAKLVLHWQQTELPESELLAIYKSSLRKILRESLSNIIKHADANEVTVKLSYDAGQFCLQIEDDGKGFDKNLAAKNKSGIGLSSIRRRVFDLGGELKIDTDHGGGSCIQVSLMLSDESYQIKAVGDSE
ncbi:MAG: ATP-binding protein [Gammaproteobacteria bacterium]|nr:ATP-binding protein [Gammaproteobacteria bacterium]